MSSFEIFTLFIFNIIVYNIPLLYGTVGEIVTEKSGSLNLGVEGTMAVGGIFGYLVGCACNSMLLGILAAFVSAGLCGLLFAFLTVTLQANQNVTGLTITTFGLGLYFVVGQGVKGADAWPVLADCVSMSNGFSNIHIPFVSDIPFIGKVLFSQNLLVYLGIIIAVVVWWYMKYTKNGLRMRSVGENPAAADSIGINITRTKYIHIILGSSIMGIGGLYMGLNLNGSFEGSSSWINGYGWISIALVIFANWNPVKAILGTFVFGLFNTLQNYSSSLSYAFPKTFGWLSSIPSQLYKALPFFITAVVLIADSIRKNSNSNEPAAKGINYYREDR